MSNAIIGRDSRIMKIILLLLTIFATTLWWEIPSLCLILSLFAICLMIFKKVGGIFFKIILIISIITIALSIWNWDLHVGMNVLELAYSVRGK